MDTIPVTVTYHIPMAAFKQAITEAIQQGMGHNQPADEFYTRSEYAKLIKCHPSRVTRLCNSGKLKFKMIGNQYRIYKNQLAKVG